MEVACSCGTVWTSVFFFACCPTCGELAGLPTQMDSEPPDAPPPGIDKREYEEMELDLDLILADHEPVYKGWTPDSE